MNLEGYKNEVVAKITAPNFEGGVEKLREILVKHWMWWCDIKGGEQANLSHADLSHANLSHADLFGANLSHADLFGAKLTSANLSYANLIGADLRYADLSHANLSYASLTDAAMPVKEK